MLALGTTELVIPWCNLGVETMGGKVEAHFFLKQVLKWKILIFHCFSEDRWVMLNVGNFKGIVHNLTI